MRIQSKGGLGLFRAAIMGRWTFGLSRHKNRLVQVLATVLAIVMAGPAMGQWSTMPSDATPSLVFNTSTTGDAITPAFPTFPTDCGGNNGPFSFANATPFTSVTNNIPYPLCAYEVPTPNLAFLPPIDMWFRLDPVTGTGGAERDYRFTVVPATTPGTGPYAGIAVYEAASATSPMTLLNCSRDGGYRTAAQRGPSVEATCITPGYKLYVRVFSYQPLLPNFSICVMNRTRGAYGGVNARNAEETPCTAPTVAAGSTTIQYAFSCREPGFNLPVDRADGGDLWAKLAIPANGQVIGKLLFGPTTAGGVGGVNSGTTPVRDNVGLTAYLSDDCTDGSRFIEVGHAEGLVSSLGTVAPNVIIRCLPPGETLYIRIHGVRGTEMRSLRYGAVRFTWDDGGLGLGTPSGNGLPCGAIPLVVGASCTGQTAGDNIGSCSYPGVPEPDCGNFNSTKSSVWYKFEAPVSGLVQIDAEPGATGSMNRPAIALYASNAGPSDPGQGCRERLSLMACDDRQGEGANARIIKGGLVPGKVYYLRVWATDTDGNFNLCISSSQPPAGHCWYMVEFWAANVNNPHNNPNMPSVTVTIPPGVGGTATTYTTHGNDQSEVFLVAVPSTGGAHFNFSSSVSGAAFRALWNPYGGLPLVQHAVSGGGEAGPGTAPITQYVVPGCEVQQHYTSDCFGMRTLCINGTVGDPAYYGPFTGWTGSYYLNQFSYNNSVYPQASNGNPITSTGSTYYHPTWGGRMDLAGANMGCLQGELQGIQWYVFRPVSDGALGFAIKGWKTSGIPVGIDVDFAVWDVGPLTYNLPPDPDHIDGYDVCPPQGPPVRCSSARVVGATGLAPYTQQEEDGEGGYGWVTPLPVQAGHAYVLAVLPVNATGALRNDIFWHLYKNALGQTDPGLLDCNPLVLPVELLFLEGWPQGGEVDLAWATASERNSSHFVVERSSDAEHFTAIGQVGAAGESQHRLDYGFTDAAPAIGINYYRLRQVDRDGSKEWSNTVAVPFKGEGNQLGVWPNPVQDRLQVGGNLKGQAEASIHLLNGLGQVVLREVLQIQGGTVEVDAGGLPPGPYLLRLLDGAGNEIGLARFVKQ